ncbi:hypothetical protein BCR43DRAFT_506384 [Syncephalastrum racemosum]|uniref:Uncharacterized protein n=1 Tax=Syncephalastrum racemosum TaxID=13706 RepID=A0A1X2HBC7_SYNRA|nr:hypothetical protein BCR43DRAFT_506384 [Syncephalastrum racemosum]
MTPGARELEQDILFAEKDQTGVEEDLLKCDRLRIDHLTSRLSSKTSRTSTSKITSLVIRSIHSTQPAILNYQKHTVAVPASQEVPDAYHQLADRLTAAISIQHYNYAREKPEITSEVLEALCEATSVC